MVRKPKVDEATLATWKLNKMILPALAKARREAAHYDDAANEENGFPLAPINQDVVNGLLQRLDGSSNMDLVNLPEYGHLRGILLTQDGCGSELNAISRYIDNDNCLLKLSVLKLHAKATAQPHDAGPCHASFKRSTTHNENILLTGDEVLLPPNKVQLYDFLLSCKMERSTVHTVYKHCINAPAFLAKAFSMEHLRTSYGRCGMVPIQLTTYLHRCPAWKYATHADIAKLNAAVPELVKISAAQGGLMVQDALQVLGSKWLLSFEQSHLDPIVHKLLLGSIIVSHKTQKQFRKEKISAHMTRRNKQVKGKRNRADLKKMPMLKN